MVSIYALINPINEKVFYVGATYYPILRLKQHCWLADGSQYKNNIIERILKSGLKTEMVVLEEVEGIEEARNTEEFYINLFKFYGFKIPQNKSGYSGNYNRCKEWLKENGYISSY